MVSVYTIDGEVTLDTAPFDKGISKMVSKLEELMSFTGTGDFGFYNQLNQNLEKGINDIGKFKEEIKTLMNSFGDAQGINALKSEIETLRNEIDTLKGKIEEMGTVANQTATQVGNTVSNVVTKTKSEVTGIANQIAEITNGIVSLMTKEEFSNYVLQQQNSELGQINAKWREQQGLIQSTTNFLNEVMQSENTIAQYFVRENELLESSLALLNSKTEKLAEVSNFSKEIGNYFARENEFLRNSLRYVNSIANAEKELADSVTVGLTALAERNVEEERELAILDMCMSTWTEINALGEENRSIVTSTINAEREIFELLTAEESAETNLVRAKEELNALLTKEIGDEEKVLSVIEEENALLSEQNGIRRTGSRVNQLDKASNLPRRIGSMAVTMWGYNELMELYDTTMAHINAESQKDYFAKRMKMNAKETKNFTNQLSKMQNEYKKIDMTVVGANALETATKYNVQQKSLGDLTEVMAIYGSEFVKQGRTQEDSILAINDALDGELRRLKEVGIGQQELKDTGLWNGDESDKEGMLKALLQIAKERGYSQTAKDITNLSDAITVLEVKLGTDLARAFETVEPFLRDVLKNFVTMLEVAEDLAPKIGEVATNVGKFLGLIDEKGNATDMGKGLEEYGSWAVTIGITLFGVYKIVKPLLGMFRKLKGTTDDMGKTTGDIGKTAERGGFKDGFKGATENIGKMAKIFLELAVAMAMAFAIIEEAILLISAVGYTYDSLKPQFDSGVEFIQEFGVWIWGASAVLIGAMAIMSKIPVDTSMITEGFTKVAVGLALAMVLVAEAIFLLNAPLLAIASLGAVRNWQRENIDSGLEVIREMGNILSSDINDTLGFFIIAFIGASVILGLVPEAMLPLAVGMALSIALVTEAIFLLNAPLLAIASLGAMSNAIGEDSINKGVQTIELIARCLIALQPAVSSLLMVDLAVFGIQLVDWGNKLLSGGKDGLTALVQDILPTLSSFLTSFNQLTFEDVKTEKIQQIVNFANQMPPLFNAIQKVNQTLGTSDMLGNIGGAVGGSVSGAIGMGLKGKLNQLYNDVKDVMDFATKVSGLNTGGDVQLGAVQQVSQVITQLNVKLKLMSATISTASRNIRTSSKAMGNAITQGFREGSVNFGAEVVKTIARGVTEVQKRYNTMMSGGKTLGNKLVSGWNAHSPKLQTTVANEIHYALQKLDDSKDKFYQRGQRLGKALHDGFESEGGLNVGSPAKITHTIAKEMDYAMKQIAYSTVDMYKGGQALGKALADGYGATGGVRTDISTLARKGVNNNELTQNTRKIAQTGNKGTKTVNMPVININMSGSTIIGIKDLDEKIQNSIDEAMVRWHSSDGAVGY